MSLNGILSTALSGLMVNQAALRVTANNIVNVNTKNYSRQVVGQENIVVSGVSTGVTITSIQRIVDNFLQAAGFDASSRASETGVQTQFNERFQGLLGRPDSDSTLAARINQIFGTLANLALAPSEQILRQTTLASIQDFADDISNLAGSIQDLRNEANQQIRSEVFAVNEALRRIDELNPQIIRQLAIGGEVAGLDNQRDQALQELSELIDIRISRNDDGRVFVTTGSGTVLLDSVRRELEYNPPGIVTSQTRFGPIEIFRVDPLSGQRIGTPRDLDPDLRSGTIRGLLDLRDGDLRDLSLTIGELARSFIDQVNGVHNSFTAVPPPNQMIGRQTAWPGIQSTVFTGTTTFAVVDSNNQLVQKVTVDFTSGAFANFNGLVSTINAGLGGIGTLSLVAGVMSFVAADSTHGVIIADDPNDPTSRGGRSFSHFFGMNDLLEAAVETNFATGQSQGASHSLAAGGATTYEVRDSTGRILTQYTAPVVGTTIGDMFADLNAITALGGFMQFTVDAVGQIVITPQPGFEDARLTVISDTTNVAGTGVTFTQEFGIGDRYHVDAAKDMRVLDTILKQPQNMALALFDLTAAIGAVAMSNGDQSGALALQKLETKVVSFEDAGDLGAISVAFGQYVAAVLANAGLKAARAERRSEDATALLTEISTRIGDVSGVNLDEELANMVILQNSYNAAARLITTTQEMFDVLFDATR